MGRSGNGLRSAGGVDRDAAVAGRRDVGLAVAILLDATVIRGVLLPATMALLGERNWYLPGWLNWLPSSESDDVLALPGGTDARAPEYESV